MTLPLLWCPPGQPARGREATCALWGMCFVSGLCSVWCHPWLRPLGSSPGTGPHSWETKSSPPSKLGSVGRQAYAVEQELLSQDGTLASLKRTLPPWGTKNIPKDQNPEAGQIRMMKACATPVGDRVAHIRAVI